MFFIVAKGTFKMICEKKKKNETKEDDRYKKTVFQSLIPVYFSFTGELTHIKI